MTGRWTSVLATSLKGSREIMGHLTKQGCSCYQSLVEVLENCYATLYAKLKSKDSSQKQLCRRLARIWIGWYTLLFYFLLIRAMDSTPFMAEVKKLWSQHRNMNQQGSQNK